MKFHTKPGFYQSDQPCSRQQSTGSQSSRKCGTLTGNTRFLFVSDMRYSQKFVPVPVSLIVFLLWSIAGHARMVPGSEHESVHPFVQTVADVFVNPRSLTVRISSSADELDLIHGIIPLENGKYDTGELLEGVEIHAEFLLERFEIYDPAGNKLEGKVTEKPDWEIPAEGVDSGRLVDYMLDFTFEYRLKERPEYLTFQNSIIDYNFALPSEVKLLVKQAGSDVPYADVLKLKHPKTIRFDWDKPLKNHLTGAELREWFNETREKTLGITSYGGVYSFIYITPREIRHEILIPLANLREFINFEQADPWYLEVDEQEKARPLIKRFFSEGNPVTVNGNIVKPVFDRFDFGGMDVRDFGKMREQKRISLANGRVGVIMSFPVRNIPDTVTVTWDKFSKMLKDVDVVVIGPDDTVEKKQFSKYRTVNTIEWTNPGIPPLPEVVEVSVDEDLVNRETLIPLISSICGIGLLFLVLSFLVRPGIDRSRILIGVVLLAGGLIALPKTTPVTFPLSVPAPIAAEDASKIFAALHSNLFRSFDYKTEEDVYDALARTTDGPLLKKIYLDMRKSLEVQEQGGAVSNIDRIEIMGGEISKTPVADADVESPDFSYLCTWELEGTVEHWGHIHRRTNRYEALFNVRNIDGLWKFTDFQAINEEQGQVVRSLRKF